ncbi:MAG: helix-turn-helix domain-containing protein [Clostridium sp.]|nr:helix-turn-helix domain-containing protein [Clostridium sp.]
MNCKPGNYAKVADFIRKFARENGRPADLVTIARGAGVPVSSAARYLKRMEEEGTVVHEGRSGYITAEQLEFIGNAAAVPFCGTVSCGLPADTALEAAQYEYFPFPSSFLRSGEYFLLEAEGDSMTGDGILEGDLVLIRAQRVPDRDMQIVVAMAGGETLLKHIHIDEEEGITELISSNPAYRTRRYSHKQGGDEEVEVQGVAVMKLSYL